MRLGILLTTFAVGASSYGCPNIQGIFKSANGFAKFETTNQGDIFRYSINGGSFVADANSHEKTAEGMTMNYSANCHENKLFLNSTIFQKATHRIQVGAGVFSLVDSETVTYDFSVTLYSSDGEMVNAMPNEHIVYKLQTPIF